MYVIQISPQGDRARVYLDPANRAPVYVMFAECDHVNKMTLESDVGTYVYERSY